MVKKETEYYGVLGIEPSASEAKIRIAYYRKASEVHPDKKPSDPDAAARFKMLGEAYQVLIHPSQREAYDRDGKHSISKDSMIDSKEVYARLFGSVLFKDYVGDLFAESKPSFDRACKIDNSEKRNERLQGVQRETQKKLARFLKDFFNQYVHAEPEAKRLSNAGVPESAQLQEDAQGGRGPTNVDRDSQMMIVNASWNACQMVLQKKDAKEEDLLSRVRETFQKGMRSQGAESSKNNVSSSKKTINRVTQFFIEVIDGALDTLRNKTSIVHDETKSDSSK